jgi:hypothetical protein
LAVHRSRSAVLQCGFLANWCISQIGILAVASDVPAGM